MGDIVTVIGSGGKTSSIFAEAKAWRQRGKKVLITTTTHMACEAPFPIAETEEECRRLLRSGSVVLFARETRVNGVQKLMAADREALKRCMGEADLILNEGDGSAGRPLKVPAEHEPVLLPGTEKIVLVAGLRGLYRPIEESCHRIPLVCGLLGKRPQDLVEEEDLARLLNEGYLSSLPKKYPGIPVEIVLNQADTKELQAAANRLGRLLDAPFQVQSLLLGERVSLLKTP